MGMVVVTASAGSFELLWMPFGQCWSLLPRHTEHLTDSLQLFCHGIALWTVHTDLSLNNSVLREPVGESGAAGEQLGELRCQIKAMTFCVQFRILNKRIKNVVFFNLMSLWKIIIMHYYPLNIIRISPSAHILVRGWLFTSTAVDIWEVCQIIAELLCSGLRINSYRSQSHISHLLVCL